VLTTSGTRRARKLAAAGAIGLILTIGSAGVASADDDQSGAEAKGDVVTRDPGGLPVTGSDVIGIVVVGAAAVGVGSTAVVATRRRASRAIA